MKARVALAAALVGLAIVAALLWNLGQQVKERNLSAAALRAQSPNMGSAASEPSAPTKGLPNTLSPSAAAPPATPADPDFQKWLSEEAKEVDQPHINSEKKRKELAAVIVQLTPTQAQQLLQTAQNSSSSAGEKILSTYLLVEGGAKSRVELRQLIATPPLYSGAQETHSEGELRSVQERSQKIMALEGLISQAEHDPAARADLAQSISTIQDSYIRSYAQKRFDELKDH